MSSFAIRFTMEFAMSLTQQSHLSITQDEYKKIYGNSRPKSVWQVLLLKPTESTKNGDAARDSSSFSSRD